jgi:uncharacterized alpha-E superfamily protein
MESKEESLFESLEQLSKKLREFQNSESYQQLTNEEAEKLNGILSEITIIRQSNLRADDLKKHLLNLINAMNFIFKQSY